jgi:hypothetical protein
MPYESWVDRQIREAIERGEFDNLPGQGKPIKGLQETLGDVADEQAVREIVRDLNHRIAESHRIRVDGPPIVIGLVNEDQAVAEWRWRRRRGAG